MGSESPLHSAGDFLEARRLSREERARAYLQEARRNLPQQPAHICGGRCARACGHPENDDLRQFTCDVGHFYDASWLAVCRSPQVVPGDVVPGQGLAKKQETAKKQTIFFWGRPPQDPANWEDYYSRADSEHRPTTTRSRPQRQNTFKMQSPFGNAGKHTPAQRAFLKKTGEPQQ